MILDAGTLSNRSAKRKWDEILQARCKTAITGQRGPLGTSQAGALPGHAWWPHVWGLPCGPAPVSAGAPGTRHYKQDEAALHQSISAYTPQNE